MNNSLMFWMLSGGLSAFILWVLWRTLRKNTSQNMQSIAQRNIAIARERAQEIDSAFEMGELTATEQRQARQDLEQTLANELASSKELGDQFTTTSTASQLIVLALVPVLAFGSYFLTSNFKAKPMQPTAPPVLASDKAPPTFDEMLKRVEKKVSENPDDKQGLFLLAQTYAQLQRYPESAARYQQLIDISEPSANLYTGLADVSAMANGRMFTPEIADILSKALAIDSEYPSALWLLGLAEQQFGQPEKALRHWLTLKPLMQQNPEASKELDVLINDVSVEIGPRADEIKQALDVNSVTAQRSKADVARLRVKVTVAPELQSKINPGDSVFIFAKAISGPPMPLAASRLSVSELPLTIELDDSMAMLPQMKLSNFAQVMVGARITKSGQAIAQTGDLQSQLVKTASNASETIELVISSIKE